MTTKKELKERFLRLQSVRAGSVFSRQQEEGMLILLAQLLYGTKFGSKQEVQVFVEEYAPHYAWMRKKR